MKSLLKRFGLRSRTGIVNEVGYTLIAVAAGVFFFTSLERLWPLAHVPLNLGTESVAPRAHDFLAARGFDLSGYRAESRLRAEESVLEYLEQHLDQRAVDDMIQSNLPLLRYQVFFKKPGSPVVYSLAMHPKGQVTGWTMTVPEENDGASLEEESARALAIQIAAEALGVVIEDWREVTTQATELPNRRRYQFVYERGRDWQPPLKETLHLTVDGDVLSSAYRRLEAPEKALVAARARKAPREAMQLFGYILMGLAGLGAIGVFLVELQRGSVALRFAVGLGVVAAGTGLLTQFLQGATLFLEWDPMWPAWVSAIKSQLAHGGQNLGILLMTVVLVGAGDAMDRDRVRGRDLHLFARGAWFGPQMAAASWRGFLLGLICGGVMAAVVWLMTSLFGGHVSIQPRGFFYYALNSNAAGITILLFFFGIALFEESAYRYFGATWFERRFKGRRWCRLAAIVVPSIIYGLTHTKLTFLPPFDPFWARALVMICVGCVWGWGFFRFGMMTVVFSHFSADLFIFNWPRLAGGEPTIVVEALLICTTPLIPAIGYALKSLFAGREEDSSVPEAA